MFKSTLLVLLAFITAMLVAAPSPALAAAGGNELRLRTKLTGNTLMSGNADYRERTDNGITVRTLKVEVEDAKPGTVYAVKHNGVVIGKITIGALGAGKLERKSVTDDPNKVGSVPVMKAGDKIVVGPVSGKLKVA